MIKMKDLLIEEVRFTAADFAQKLKLAYTTIFDIDDVKVVEHRDLLPPSACNAYLTTNISIRYKFKKFFIYHKLFYDKLPRSHRKGLSADEWDKMLSDMDKLPRRILTADMLKSRNPQIAYDAGVYEDHGKEGEHNFFELKPLGDVNDARDMLELVTKVKSIIDHSSSEPGHDEDNVTPPTTPTGHDEEEDDVSVSDLIGKFGALTPA